MKVKKAWVAPKLEVQKFVANEYIASCWEVASVWNPDKSMLIQKDPTPSAEDDDQFFKGVAGEWWYSGGKLGSPFDNESLENGARWVVLEEINEENNDKSLTPISNGGLILAPPGHVTGSASGGVSQHHRYCQPSTKASLLPAIL